MKRSGFKRSACKICKIKQVARLGAIVCGLECALKYQTIASNKAARAESRRVKIDDRERRDKLKTLSQYADEAQAVVNQYVKYRDWGLNCISCDKPHKFDVTRNASHLKSRGSNSFLRFNLWNIHMACVQCNMHKGGNISEYYPRLVAKIGQEKVDFLNTAPKSREYSKEYCLRLKRIFTKKVKRIKNGITI